jgi:hypothetical protein
VNIAVYTRGYARDYRWKSTFSGLSRGDDLSDQPVSQCLSQWQLDRVLAEHTPGIGISRIDSRFTVLLTDVPTAYRTPVAPGKIRICFLFIDLTENEAMALSHRYLSRWTETCKVLEETLIRDCASQEWDFDDAKLASFVKSLVRSSPQGRPSQSASIQMAYINPLEGGFDKYAEYLANAHFSGTDGLKLAIGCPSSTDAHAIIGKADFSALTWRLSKNPESLTAPYPKPIYRHATLLAVAGALIMTLGICFFLFEKGCHKPAPIAPFKRDNDFSSPIGPYRFDPPWRWLPSPLVDYSFDRN